MSLLIQTPRNIHHSYHNIIMAQNNAQIHLTLNRYHNMVSLYIARASLPHVMSSYVRVQLLNDESSRLDHTTPVYQHTTYKEHISWEMCKEDYICPVRVSVYKRHITTGDAECIGYVNINIIALLTGDTINQWFTLTSLKPTPVITKHRTNKHPTQSRTRRIPRHHTATYCRLPTSTLPTSKVLIVRPSSTTSFGLSVAGHGPTHIVRIQPQSAADRAGLQAGDQIYSIGDVKVQLYTSDRIAQLLKHQDVLTEMCVLRSTTSTSNNTTVLHRSLPTKLSTSLNTSSCTSFLTHHLSFISDSCRSAQ